MYISIILYVHVYQYNIIYVHVYKYANTILNMKYIHVSYLSTSIIYRHERIRNKENWKSHESTRD